MRRMRKMGQRGVSLIAAVVALLLLSILGVSLVSIVSVDLEMRQNHTFKEQAFYAVQAGLEYALREIRQGGYPLAVDKVLNDPLGSHFSVTINTSNRRVTVTGEAGVASRTHSAVAPQLASNCFVIDSSSADLSGNPSWSKLINLKGRKTCMNGVRIDKIRMSWTPNNGEKVTMIELDGNRIYNDATGSVSGVEINVTDSLFSDANNHLFSVTFSSPMFIFGNPGALKTLTFAVVFTDGSGVTASFPLQVFMGSG